MDRESVLHHDLVQSAEARGPMAAHALGQAMKIRVLGCSGGIGGSLRTTALLVDDDVLIDAGTGVGDLSLESLARIDHIFVTHSHLDHVTSIPFLVVLGFSPILWTVVIAMAVRNSLMNAGNPIFSAFAMDQVVEGTPVGLLDRGERPITGIAE